MFIRMRGRRIMASRKTKVKFNQKRVNRILRQIPVAIHAAATDAGLRPALNVVKKRMEELAPDSKASGSRDKWSQSMKASRSRGDKQLKDTIKIKVIKGGKNSVPYGMVGPERPEGNVAHFVAPLEKDTREKVLWGNRTGTTAPKNDDFTRRAFDDTQKQQQRAFTRGVLKRARKEMAEAVRG